MKGMPRSARKNRVASAGRTVGQTAAGGAMGGAALGLAESAWLAFHTPVHTGAGLFGYGLALYGAAGLAFGAFLGVVAAVAARISGRALPAPEAAVTTGAGLVIVFLGLPVTRFLLGRDVFMERMAWGSTRGLVIQGIVIACLCLVMAAIVVGVRRLLERAPAAFSSAWLPPLAIAAASAALLAVSAGKDAPRVEYGDGGKSVPGPNVVLVMVDTLRADATDPYGGDLTPSLGKLAKKGVVFENAYAHSSWTRPSVATVLTGRYPRSHGAMYKMDSLPDGVETIAETLSASGYATQGIVTNYVTAPYFNFGQGFDEYRYLEPGYLLGADEVSSKLNLYELLKKVEQKVSPRTVKPNAQYRQASDVTNAALGWLDGRKRDYGKHSRFFLFVQYMDPHDPYLSHPFDGTAVSRKATPDPPAGMKEKMRALYDGEVSYWDGHFGRLMKGLEAMPYWEDTLVVVFADHGEEFLEHGGWWHGDTMYEEAIRVPIVVRLPGDEAAGTRIPDLVGLADIAPTIARLVTGKVPESYQGHDLFQSGDAPVLGDEQHVGNDVRSLVYRVKGGALWKVIMANEGNPRGMPAKSLFDLGKDPHEKTNLAAVGKGDDLRLALESLGKALEESAKGAVAKKAIEIDEKSKKHLEELGYIRDDEKQ